MGAGSGATSQESNPLLNLGLNLSASDGSMNLLNNQFPPAGSQPNMMMGMQPMGGQPVANPAMMMNFNMPSRPELQMVDMNAIQSPTPANPSEKFVSYQLHNWYSLSIHLVYILLGKERVS